MTAFLSKGLQIHSDAFQINDPEKAFGVTRDSLCCIPNFRSFDEP